MKDGQPPIDSDFEAAAAGAARRGPCPGDDRLLVFYQGDLDQAGEETIRDHLASCADCVARARDARDFAVTVGAAVGPAPASRWRRGAWLGLAAAIAGLAIVGLWSVRRGTGTPPANQVAAIAWSDLAVAPALYAPAHPSGDAGGDVVYRDGTAGDPFAAAMERYGAGDFATAETALESLVAARAGGEQARFYLAVTRLINGRAEDARRELMSLDRSGGVTNHDEIGWYLALALLKTGRTADARERLGAIAAGGGAHATEAGALLERIEPGTGR